MSKIELNHVSVSYILGDFSTTGIKDVIIQKIKRQYKVKEFLAVNDVTCSIEKGDLLGIIGTNGAGKSTLLKVISGIMRPTAGTMAVDGNIASLLELGTGFDGDLTVKENTFLRGAMLGYTREFMNNTYNDILKFAELTEYEDRLFSHLSSGMKSRLAFSIACLVKPDILIIDEVLSVGDGAFRKRSEEKMMEIIKGGATTILVSHSLAQIRRLATKVLWLDHGKQIAFGETKEVCDQYEAFLKNK
ncbi:MAG: ABC transporter ATP-binding protein [Ruminococcus sp.]|nr:ABC transporter ATP-binding protein [Ruminococcus sp.]MDD6634775.1 ABC transporter ATP-binding protein [Ruminococcus sp.]MDY3214701.1 ABC transporter ATP-binding protein [Ruminococcus sp.]CDF02851.1 aBC-type polysaccharide/polyol phosphate transport system ATPase component [Ruminococcus sp. CAG:624]HOF69371.1 ABC transporter ATP-binding protein [Ruminococcus sp.]